jgi:hypothetical protein
VANIQLKPSKEQAQSLKQTLKRCIAAGTDASRVGFEAFGMKARQFNRQKIVYRRLDVPDPEAIGIEDVLGIDLGIVNLA